MKELICLIFISMDFASGIPNPVAIVNSSIGSDFKEFSEKIPKDRVVGKGGENESIKFDSDAKYAEYLIDDHMRLGVFYSKRNNYIKEMSLVIAPKGCRIPKDFEFKLNLEKIIINDDGTVSFTCRAPSIPSPFKKARDYPFKLPD